MNFAKLICLCLSVAGAILLLFLVDAKVRAEESFWAKAVLSVVGGEEYSSQPDWVNDDISAD